MKYLFFVLFLGVLSFFSCKSEPTAADEGEQFDERIEQGQLDSIRTELKKAMPNVPVDLYRKAIAMHLQFVEYNPDDAFAPTALDYAQGYYEQIQDLRSSINVINRLLREYPDYKGKQMLMYNKATHHDFLRDTLEARQAYEAYLAEFPNLSKAEREEIEELIELVPYSLAERIKMQSEKLNSDK
jgi:tetratricopeptide (TPR) repeat protein